jgi:hexosaminidase
MPKATGAVPPAGAGNVVMITGTAEPGAPKGEGYRMTVSSNTISIVSGDGRGLFYGAQTLFQLLPVEVFSPTLVTGKQWSVPAVTIEDQPRFAWRSYMLDEARHFQGKAEVKRLLDQMAMLKMNIFHWHLTDDGGWRIEIRKYPKLTEVGGFRKDSHVGGFGSKARSGKPHGGFYTRDDIREIVRYAAERNITIVPEIEMPGHCGAMVAAYPWVGSEGKLTETPVQFGMNHDALRVTDPKVRQFMKDILDEVIELFPGEVIHCGGDEVGYNFWTSSPAIMAEMKAMGIRTPQELQVDFMTEIAAHLKSKGRRMMGWSCILGEDIAASKLSTNAIVQLWLDNSASVARQAGPRGFELVNSFHRMTYLDYGFGLDHAYSFSPVPAELERPYQDKIIGLGCQMWAEWTPDAAAVERRTFPRIAAYAETGWTPQDLKNFEDFQRRMNVHKERWAFFGIH